MGFAHKSIIFYYNNDTAQQKSVTLSFYLYFSAGFYVGFLGQSSNEIVVFCHTKKYKDSKIHNDTKK